MNQHQMFLMNPLSVIDVMGADAATIVHNVTTNQIRTLETGQGCESFVTDVRGKTLGHFGVYRNESLIRLIGAGGQSQRVASHLDRYTIREDATAMVRDEDYAALAIAPELAAKLSESLGDGVMLRHRDISIAGTVCQFYGCRWIGEGSGVLLTAIEQRETLAQSLSQQFDVALESEHAFHQARTIARFPWFGIDLDESNLPQEADRDGVAISFTKGCYLGQETVARLDALGQVQKKLVAWSIAGTIPLPGTALQSGDKVVGRLTSVAATIEGGAIAIGPARRSHFERGSVASGQLGPEGPEFIATVI